jgi:hypothetical protein
MLENARQAILENLAIVRVAGPCDLAEAARRDAGGTVEGAHEIRQIAEADIECDIADRPIVGRESAGGAAQARTQQVLMRRHADDARKQSQEMKGTQPRLTRGTVEIDGLVRVRIEPERCFDRTPAIAW